MKTCLKHNHAFIVGLAALWTTLPAQFVQANTTESSQDKTSTLEKIVQTVPSGTGILRQHHLKIRSKHYRIVFPSPPATSKEEYTFAASIGSNGELSYFASCPTSGTSLGMGILLGSATFADNNIKLPKACLEVQRATEDIVQLKQGRDAADTLGHPYRIVLEKAIFLRGLRALAYTQTQINGLLNQQKNLYKFRPPRTDISSLLTEVRKKENEEQIQILQEDLNRLQSIVISTGHEPQILIDSIQDRKGSKTTQSNQNKSSPKGEK